MVLLEEAGERAPRELSGLSACLPTEAQAAVFGL